MNKSILLLFVLLFVPLVLSQPTGVSITFNETEVATPAPAAELTTAGGSFTTLVLEGVFQNPRWKAYVGNVSGSLTLDDASGNTIYNWATAAVSGEVYVSRNNSVEWSSVSCASSGTITTEETFLNMSSSASDSINSTFNQTIHRSFFIGVTPIAESTCRSIATYINDTAQSISTSSAFQEVLLQDGNSNVIYATMLEEGATGFDGSNYDFQMIVPEDSSKITPTTYYFYVQLN
jgi:hypothetical protein